MKTDMFLKISKTEHGGAIARRGGKHRPCWLGSL